MQKCFKLIFCLSLFFQNSFSQDLFSRQISLSRENPDIKYNTIFSDANGLMWIGTSAGLYQYDGIDFLLFTLPEKKSDNNVSAIMQDKNKTIWVGYQSGKIARLIHDSLVLFSPGEGLPSKPITSILQDKKGTVWISTAGEGIYYFINNRLYNINEDDGLTNNHAYCLTEDYAGNIWTGTDQGITICNAYSKIRIINKLTYKDDLPDEIVMAIQKDKEENMWMATQEKGICKFDVKQNKIVIPDEFQSWNYGQVNSLIVSDLELWAGTEDNGLVIHNSALKENTNYTVFNNVKIKKLNAMQKDNEGNIWCISNNEILITQGNTLRFFNKIKDQKISFVHTILSSRDNYLFFSPDQQLVSVSTERLQNEVKKYNITTPEKLIDIVSLYEDSCAYIWIGTMGEGVFRLNTKTGFKQKITGYAALDKASILSINGVGNEIWLATLEGVIRCTIHGNCHTDKIKYTFTGFEKQKEIGNYFIYKIFVDSKKRIWFGTDGKGLTLFDKNTFKSYDEKHDLKSKVVYSISEDSKHNIWFSTDSGIYKFNGTTFTNYNLNNGLRELVSGSILCDDNGNTIIVHHRGIDVLNISSGIIQYFDISDRAQELNSDPNSITTDSKGNIWIGTEKGIIKFNSHFKNFSARSVSLIKKVTLLTDNVALVNGINLKHNQNNISVEFAGIWFTDPDLVKYQYKLSGHDKDWIATKDRKLIFPNLAPGNYVFQLKSAAGNNFNTASEATFTFTINKPFWDEMWFRFLVIVILGGIAFLFLKLRDRNMRRLHLLEKEKIEFQFETLKSQVNPHFLFNSFNTLISIIETDKNIAVEYVENLSEYFRNLINYRDKDLIPLEEELKLTTAYYFLQQKRFGNNLTVSIEIDKNKAQWTVPPLVVQILLENAIKHNAISRETPLLINIITEKDKLIVKNNINQKYSVEKSTGTGIKNVIARYELLTKEKVEVVKTEKDFIAAIPLIKTDET